jgi:hypothetical protein
MFIRLNRTAIANVAWAVVPPACYCALEGMSENGMKLSGLVLWGAVNTAFLSFPQLFVTFFLMWRDGYIDTRWGSAGSAVALIVMSVITRQQKDVESGVLLWFVYPWLAFLGFGVGIFAQGWFSRTTKKQK